MLTQATILQIAYAAQKESGPTRTAYEGSRKVLRADYTPSEQDGLSLGFSSMVRPHTAPDALLAATAATMEYYRAFRASLPALRVHLHQPKWPTYVREAVEQRLALLIAATVLSDQAATPIMKHILGESLLYGYCIVLHPAAPTKAHWLGRPTQFDKVAITKPTGAPMSMFVVFEDHTPQTLHALRNAVSSPSSPTPSPWHPDAIDRYLRKSFPALTNADPDTIDFDTLEFRDTPVKLVRLVRYNPATEKTETYIVPYDRSATHIHTSPSGLVSSISAPAASLTIGPPITDPAARRSAHHATYDPARHGEIFYFNESDEDPVSLVHAGVFVSAEDNHPHHMLGIGRVLARASSRRSSLINHYTVRTMTAGNHFSAPNAAATKAKAAQMISGFVLTEYQPKANSQQVDLRDYAALINIEEAQLASLSAFTTPRVTGLSGRPNTSEVNAAASFAERNRQGLEVGREDTLSVWLSNAVRTLLNDPPEEFLALLKGLIPIPRLLGTLKTAFRGVRYSFQDLDPQRIQTRLSVTTSSDQRDHLALMQRIALGADPLVEVKAIIDNYAPSVTSEQAQYAVMENEIMRRGHLPVSRGHNHTDHITQHLIAIGKDLQERRVGQDPIDLYTTQRQRLAHVDEHMRYALESPLHAAQAQTMVESIATITAQVDALAREAAEEQQRIVEETTAASASATAAPGAPPQLTPEQQQELYYRQQQHEQKLAARAAGDAQRMETRAAQAEANMAIKMQQAGLDSSVPTA